MKYDRWDVEISTDWPTEALLDLVPDQDNKLSVWHIDDEQSNLERIISALTAIRYNISHFDYVLIDCQLLRSMHITIETTIGNSPDEEANRLWHRNLCGMNSAKCLELAEAIRGNSKVKRCLQKEVLRLCKESVKDGFYNLDKTNLKQSERVKIQKLVAIDKSI